MSVGDHLPSQTSGNEQTTLERPTLVTDELTSAMYEQLRRLAAHRLSSFPAGTLTATALVHEAYLRLVESKDAPGWSSRGHFLCAAAAGMRRILVENARRKRSVKRGGHLRRDELLEADAVVDPTSGEDLVALDDALTELESVDAQAARFVCLRYFAGLTIDETAQALDVSPRTADRIWAYARAWLYDRLLA
jgi:RNA polymerase sigma factor (TIGR02999 family)